MRALLILTLCGLSLPVLWLMHRSGAGYLPLQLRRPWLLLLLIFGIRSGWSSASRPGTCAQARGGNLEHG